MWVWVVFIGGGLGFLIGLAITIARASAEDYAWRAIAAERRELQERRLDERAAAVADPNGY